MRFSKIGVMCAAIGFFSVHLSAAPAAQAEAFPQGSHADIYWTKISGDQASYDGRSLQVACGMNQSVKNMPDARPKEYRLYVAPCYVDEEENAGSYFDKLNWSIASADVLNDWMVLAAQHQCRKIDPPAIPHRLPPLCRSHF